MKTKSKKCPYCGTLDTRVSENAFCCRVCGRSFGLTKEKLDELVLRTKRISFGYNYGPWSSGSIEISKDICVLHFYQRKGDYCVTAYEKIDEDDFNKVVRDVYKNAFVNDWEQHYITDECVYDGYSWGVELDYSIFYQNSGEDIIVPPKIISGYVLYPPYFKEFKKILKPFFKKCHLPFELYTYRQEHRLCLSFLSCLENNDFSGLATRKSWKPEVMRKHPDLYLFLLRQATMHNKPDFVNYLLQLYVDIGRL